MGETAHGFRVGQIVVAIDRAQCPRMVGRRVAAAQAVRPSTEIDPCGIRYRPGEVAVTSQAVT